MSKETTEAERVYVRGFAYRGEPSDWGAALEGAADALPGGGPELDYNTRRLDTMVAFAVDAALAALQRSGLSTEERRSLGALAFSHNGPCAYSEEFFAQLLTEEDPRLVSPTLFAESVLNIAGTHISLATGSRCPVHALNTGLADFLDVFDTLFLLTAGPAFARGVLCACDEFSALCARLFARCPDFPGRRFVSAATAMVFSTAPGAAGGAAIEAPGRAAADGFAAIAAPLAERGVLDWIPGAYAAPETADLPLPGGAAWTASPLDTRAMEQEQGFAASRLGEVLAIAARGRPAALVERHGDRCRWLPVNLPVK